MCNAILKCEFAASLKGDPIDRRVRMSHREFDMRITREPSI
jgi:hypothetical protein